MTRGDADAGATTRMVRRLNAERVLRALRASGPMRVSELAVHAGLSRPTVAGVAEDLARLGLVGEVDEVRPSRPRTGRPARTLAFRADAGFVLGIDAGAHTVRVAAADLRGEVVAERIRAFEHPDVEAPERLAVVRETAASALASAGVGRQAVILACVGFPGGVDAESGVVRFSGLPGFSGMNLRAEVEQALGRPAIVENDANLAVLGERWRGVAAGADDVICTLTGERLGTGILVGGRLVRGHASGAGEMEFISTWEGEGGAWGIAHLVRELGGEAVTAGRAPVISAAVDGDPARVEAETVFAAARSGDPVATDIVERMCRRAGRAIGTVALVLNPELIVVGGGAARAGDVVLEPIRRQIEAMIWLPTRVEASTLLERGPVVGAIRHALDHLEPRLLDGLDEAA